MSVGMLLAVSVPLAEHCYFQPIWVMVQLVFLIIIVLVLAREHRMFLTISAATVMFGIHCLDAAAVYLFLVSQRGGSAWSFSGSVPNKAVVFLCVRLVLFTFLECVDVRKKLHDTKENQKMMALFAVSFLVIFMLADRGLEKGNLQMEISGGILIFGMGSAIVMMAALFHMLSEEKKRLYEIQMRNTCLEENFRLLEKKQKEIARMSHDFKNHIRILDDYMEEKEYDEALDYIRMLKKPVEDSEREAYCGDKTADLIMNEKIAQAKQQDIQVHVDVEETGKLPFTSFDTCAIFANLLDNAVEACRNVELGNRVLKVELKKRGPVLTYLVENSMKDKPVKKSGNYVSAKKEEGMHGIGLESVEQSLKEYHGELHTAYTDEWFQAKVTVFL